MRELLYLIPISMLLGLVGLAAFMWALKQDQYDDLDGAAERILEDCDRPLPPEDESCASPESEET